MPANNAARENRCDIAATISDGVILGFNFRHEQTPRLSARYIRCLERYCRITFDTIRDGAYTAAIEAGADLTQAKLLAGHKVGMLDHYIRRNPKMVADCCSAIEAHYFPEPV